MKGIIQNIELSLSFVLVIAIISACQPKIDLNCNFDEHNQYVQKAMLEYSGDKFEASLISFERAFSIMDAFNGDDYFYAAAAALKTDNEEKANVLIRRAVLERKVSREYFESFNGFDGYRHLPSLVLIDKEFESLKNKGLLTKKNVDVINEIDVLVERDQNVRDGLNTYNEMRVVDSMNILRLIEITEQYGWQERAWILLWHHRGTFKDDNYVWNYFRPKINDLISKCQLHPAYWARYEDFYHILNFNEQVYGTMWGNYDSYPIRDLATVDQRRQEMGLPSLLYMHIVYHADLPEGYLTVDKMINDFCSI